MLKRLLHHPLLFFLPYFLFLPFFALDIITPEIPGTLTFAWDQSTESADEAKASVVRVTAVQSHPTPESEALLRLAATAPLYSAVSASLPEWRTPVRARSALSHVPAASVEAH